MLVRALLPVDSFHTEQIDIYFQRCKQIGKPQGKKERKNILLYRGITVIFIKICCLELTPGNFLTPFGTETIKDVIDSKQNCISYNHTTTCTAAMLLHMHTLCVNSQRSEQGIYES